MFNMIPDENDPRYQQYMREQGMARPMGQAPNAPRGGSMPTMGGGMRESPGMRAAMMAGLQAAPPAYGSAGAPRSATPPSLPAGARAAAMSPMFGGARPTPQALSTPGGGPMASPAGAGGGMGGGAGFQRTYPTGPAQGASPAAGGAAAGASGASAAAPIVGVILDYVQRQRAANDMRRGAQQDIAGQYAASTGYPTYGLQAARARRDADEMGGQGDIALAALNPLMSRRVRGF